MKSDKDEDYGLRILLCFLAIGIAIFLFSLSYSTFITSAMCRQYTKLIEKQVEALE